MKIEFPRRQNRAPIPVAGLKQMLARAPNGNSEMNAALVRLGDAYEGTINSTALHMADTTITSPARTVRSARAARRTLGGALELLAKARVAADEGRANMQRQIAKVFEYSDFPSSMVSAEIRAHFAALPADSRMKALNEAVEASDVVTLKAIGTGPAFLAGLNAERHAYARNALIDQYPEAKASRDGLAAFAEQAEFACLLEATVLQGAAELIDFAQADSFEAVAANAAA